MDQKAKAKANFIDQIKQNKVQYTKEISNVNNRVAVKD